MYLVDIYFLWVVMALALIFTILTFIWKNMWWFGLLAGTFWILLGLWAMGTLANPIMAYQNYLGIIFIVIGIGVVFLPLYLIRREKDKSMADMINELDGVDEFKKDQQEFDEGVQQYRRLGRKRRI